MNIYVGNLDFNLGENDLNDLFKEYGKVTETKIITDKFSGRSKGFGFITMENEDEGKKAIDELNGTTLKNKQIIVSEAREKKDSFNKRRF